MNILGILKVVGIAVTTILAATSGAKEIKEEIEKDKDANKK